jgi:hypothetical protein
VQLLEGAQLLADLIASYEQSFDQQQQQAGGVDADFSGETGAWGWREHAPTCLLYSLPPAANTPSCL